MTALCHGFDDALQDRLTGLGGAAATDDLAAAEGAFAGLLRGALGSAHLGRFQIGLADHDFILCAEVAAADVVVLILGRGPVAEDGIVVLLDDSRRLHRIARLEGKDLEIDIVAGVFFDHALELGLGHDGGLAAIGRLAFTDVALQGWMRLVIVKEATIGLLQLVQEEIRNAGLAGGGRALVVFF